MLQVGESVEKYVVERELGTGGMASVFLVRHRQLGGLHALKLLTSSTASQRERLVREGQAQATLRHPNIVEVRDVVDVRGHLGLLMEFVDGPTLAQVLSERRLSLPEVDHLFAGILAAVTHAHAHGMIHRDLKPANVLLCQGARGAIPKVTDFGLVKVVADGDGGGNTQTNLGMGTPAYMSPEQIQDSRTADHRTDLFALGCILYEMVTGVSPFLRHDTWSTLSAVMASKYEAPERLVPDLPEPLRRTIAACLQPDREDRPADCAALVELLRADPPVAGPAAPATGARPAAPSARPATTRGGAGASQPSLARAPKVSGASPRAGILAVAGVGTFLVAIVVGAGVIGGSYWLWAGRAAPAPAAASAATSTTPSPERTEPKAATSTPAAPAAVEKPVKAAPKATLPTAKSAPSKPVAAPVAVEAPPAAAVSEEAPTTGSVVVTGDATKVRLIGAGGSFEPRTNLPAGHYRVEAAFAGGELAPAGAIDLAPGTILRLQCSSVFSRCDAR